MRDPAEEYWGEEGEPKPIIARVSRPQFEMQQVLPGEDPDDPFSDPITESNDLNDAGDSSEPRSCSMRCSNPTCDALTLHAHLGNFDFDDRPKDTRRHYEIRMRIGALSLGADFDGIVLWLHTLADDQQPAVPHWYSPCLWRVTLTA